MENFLRIMLHSNRKLFNKSMFLDFFLLWVSWNAYTKLYVVEIEFRMYIFVSVSFIINRIIDLGGSHINIWDWLGPI